jgi:hypothetical protein
VVNEQLQTVDLLTGHKLNINNYVYLIMIVMYLYKTMLLPLCVTFTLKLVLNRPLRMFHVKAAVALRCDHGPHYVL